MSRKSVGAFDKQPGHRLWCFPQAVLCRPGPFTFNRDSSVRRALIILGAIVFAVGCAAAAAYLELKTYAVTPASPSTEE